MSEDKKWRVWPTHVAKNGSQRLRRHGEGFELITVVEIAALEDAERTCAAFQKAQFLALEQLVEAERRIAELEQRCLEYRDGHEHVVHKMHAELTAAQAEIKWLKQNCPPSVCIQCHGKFTLDLDALSQTIIDAERARADALQAQADALAGAVRLAQQDERERIFDDAGCPGGAFTIETKYDAVLTAYQAFKAGGG